MSDIQALEYNGYVANISVTETKSGEWEATYELRKDGGSINGGKVSSVGPYKTKDEADRAVKINAQNHIDSDIRLQNG
jgi:hypothetical protein